MTGTVSGPNRASLIEAAEMIAAEYFGTDEVTVHLVNEAEISESKMMNGLVVSREFTAGFEADPTHAMVKSLRRQAEALTRDKDKG